MEGVQDSNIRVTIRHVAERASDSITRPAGESRVVYDAPSGEIAYFDAFELLYLDDGKSVRALADQRQGTISISVADDDPASRWIASHPFFTIPLIDLLKRHDRYSLHAACLSLCGHGLLIAGTSGSGKSTLTLGLLGAGFDFLGDDMVFLCAGSDVVQAHAFPDEIDVTNETIRFFPELSHLLDSAPPSGWPKHQVRPEEIYGIEPAMHCTPRMLVIPQISGVEQSAITPLDRDAALLELAPNILLTDPVTSQQHFDILAALVRQCRCYRLDTGTDLRSTARLLRALLLESPD